MQRDAVVEELIQVNPCIVKHGELPEKIDKDPAWRSTAVLTRDEVQQLILVLNRLPPETIALVEDERDPLRL